MVHIPHDVRLAQDKVWVHDNGCPASDGVLEVKPYDSIWHIQDARHAMTVEPDRYSLVGLRHNQLPPAAKIETGGGVTAVAPGPLSPNREHDGPRDANYPRTAIGPGPANPVNDHTHDGLKRFPVEDETD